MSDKQKAVDKLKTAHNIIVDHCDAFAAWEAFELATAFRYLLAYIEDGEEVMKDE